MIFVHRKLFNDQKSVKSAKQVDFSKQAGERRWPRPSCWFICLFLLLLAGCAQPEVVSNQRLNGRSPHAPS